VHPTPAAFTDFLSYVPEPWATRERWGVETRGEGTAVSYHVPGGASRVESRPADGAPAGSQPELMREQLLEGIGVDVAMLLALVARPVAHPGHEAALAEGSNRWLAERWLAGPDGGRYRAGIRVAAEAPELAVAEIDRALGHSDRFNQILITPNILRPLGQPMFDPIYRAAQERGLPVTLHLTRPAGVALVTPVGFPGHFLEVQAMYALLYASHLVSMVFSGVFERFPGLRVILVEGGLAWLPPLISRMDRNWEGLRAETPWLRRPPSEYVKDHVFVTTQPIEEPQTGRREFADVLAGHERFVAENVMFSTDYPHWDADEPRWVLRQFPESVHEAIVGGTARRVFGL
jgi:predicted TIM-barrel fold metal-dependent hydrolase